MPKGWGLGPLDGKLLGPGALEWKHIFAKSCSLNSDVVTIVSLTLCVETMSS